MKAAVNPLKEARKARKLSQTAVAAQARVTQPQLSDIENGRSQPRVDTLYRVADAVGLDELAAALKPFVGDES